MLYESKIEGLKITIAAAKQFCLEYGISEDEVAQEFGSLDVRVEDVSLQLKSFESMRYGIRLALLGNHFAVQAGHSIQSGLFELSDAEKEQDLFLEDAPLFYELWQSASSAEEFRSKLCGSPMRSFMFGLAAVRVMSFFSAVRERFDFEHTSEVTLHSRSHASKEEK